MFHRNVGGKSTQGETCSDLIQTCIMLVTGLSLKSSIPKDFNGIEIARENVTLVREIGAGEFGVVMEASATNLPGQPKGVVSVAVKLMKDTSESARSSFMDEAARLRPLHHENVVGLLAVCFRSEPLMIVLELMPHGDLKTFLRRVKGDGLVGQQHLLKLSMDVGHGFRYLQEMKFVHRDIAARNVVLSGTYVAKISDFGLHE